MDEKLKLQRCISCLLPIISLLILFSTAESIQAGLKWTFFARQATIEGFVFIDKRFGNTSYENIQVETVDRTDFFRNVLDKYRNKQPLKGATISFNNTGISTQTNDFGHFKVKRWWLNARKDEMIITAPRIELKIIPDFKKSLRNFFIIDITKEGLPRIYCLEENKEKDKISNVVILVHGFGVDIGGFTFSSGRNSWHNAYNLFRTDQGLSDYEVYMLDHWDDQSLVQSSFELACFLRLVRQAYGPKTNIILMGHSAGALITRHYTVSTHYVKGTVDRYLMLAPPNKGSGASLIHWESAKTSDGEIDGDGLASEEITKGSDFLHCLNNNSKTPFNCKRYFLIDSKLQDDRGLNPDIPCAIIAGEIKGTMDGGINNFSSRLQSSIRNWFGSSAENLLTIITSEFKGSLSEIPEGDLLVSLKSQLIEGVPYVTLPYFHGFIHRPEDCNDDRYLVMKRFLLTGKLTENVKM